jgi:sirohydrochlorin cobaltochelatase
MLILIAHGSRDPRWRTSVEGVVDSLQRELGPGAVRLAYMDCTPPTLMDVASEAVAGGVTSVRILPLFLAEEGHVERDVQPLVEEVRCAFPDIAVERLPPVGQRPEFREALARIVGRTVNNPAGPVGEAGWEKDARPKPGRWGWWAP